MLTGPPKGALHTLQRGRPGKRANARRPRRCRSAAGPSPRRIADHRASRSGWLPD